LGHQDGGEGVARLQRDALEIDPVREDAASAGWSACVADRGGCGGAPGGRGDQERGDESICSEGEAIEEEEGGRPDREAVREYKPRRTEYQ